MERIWKFLGLIGLSLVLIGGCNPDNAGGPANNNTACASNCKGAPPVPPGWANPRAFFVGRTHFDVTVSSSGPGQSVRVNGNSGSLYVEGIGCVGLVQMIQPMAMNGIGSLIGPQQIHVQGTPLGTFKYLADQTVVDVSAPTGSGGRYLGIIAWTPVLAEGQDQTTPAELLCPLPNPVDLTFTPAPAQGDPNQSDENLNALWYDLSRGSGTGMNRPIGP